MTPIEHLALQAWRHPVEHALPGDERSTSTSDRHGTVAAMSSSVPNSDHKHKMIDLFAGAGGLSEGLREAGFKSLYANEIVPVYARTFAANHPDAVVDSRDIRDVDPAEVRASLGVKKGELSLVAGGPPCQGFSINAPKRSADDQRNHLFKNFLTFVEEFEPRAVLIENVPGLVSFEGGATLDAILTALKDLGYQADVQILYAPLFGVPQTRWRTIILALKDGLDPHTAFPEPFRIAPMRVNFTSRHAGREIVAIPKSLELPPHTTVREAISDLPVLENGEEGDAIKEYRLPAQGDYQKLLRAGSEGVQNHEAPRLGKVNLDRLKHIPQGGNWTDIPHELLPAGMKRARRTDHTKRYGRVSPDGLASTILTKCDPHWGAYFHYDQDRCFTVREAARIQSFPDSYVFTGSRIEQYEQVGNAVPPLLAAAVGRSIMGALGEHQMTLKRAI
jgi:DNA (cytosine-5)-methyltransferase 1